MGLGLCTRQLELIRQQFTQSLGDGLLACPQCEPVHLKQSTAGQWPCRGWTGRPSAQPWGWQTASWPGPTRGHLCSTCLALLCRPHRFTKTRACNTCPTAKIRPDSGEFQWQEEPLGVVNSSHSGKQSGSFLQS